ncbi:unnamed protein product [Heterobilharzia americana]|nr:unnamed protein product [Heterobilharzia americana]CAH8536347.1 unnamed protein product [Heterobilharzia americana]
MERKYSSRSQLPEIDEGLDYQYNTVNWLIKTKEPACVGGDARKQLRFLLLKQSELSRSLFNDNGVFKVPFSDAVFEEDGCAEYAFDWFPPSDQSVLPKSVVVYIHGGFWQAIGWKESSHWAFPVTNAGSIFISLVYRLAPKEQLEVMPQRLCLGMQKAMNLTQQKFSQLHHTELNITLVGHSAGAHLILEMIHWAQIQSVSNRNWLCCLKNLILISGVYDLRPIIHTSVNQALKLRSVEEAWSRSPIRHFTQDSPNTLLQKPLHWLVAWAEYDSPAMQRQSEVLVELLKSASNRSEQTTSSMKFTYEVFYITNEDHFTTILQLHNGPDNSSMMRKILELIIATQS